jgi:hypothetical protein
MNIREIICLIATAFTVHLVRGNEATLSEITNATKIVVRTSDSGWLAVKWISETQEVQKIVSFVNQQREAWDRPLLTTASMGSMILDIYDKQGRQASFGIGENFFGAEQNAKVWWKYATNKQKNELLLLIGDLPITLKDVTLPEVLRVTQILVLTNGVVVPEKTITNSSQIEKITKFINQQRTGWDKPDACIGKPAPAFQLELQDKEGFLREFGIGEDYFETSNYETDIISRYKKAAKEQREAILRLVDHPKE